MADVAGDGLIFSAGVAFCEKEDEYLTHDKRVIERLLNTVQGVLLTGGHDVDPEIYGEECIPECGKTCRGIQFLNAYLGGTLYQDLPSQHASDIEHHQKPPYDEPVHSVNIMKDSGLYRLLGKDTIQVNSYHHHTRKGHRNANRMDQAGLWKILGCKERRRKSRL